MEQTLQTTIISIIAIAFMVTISLIFSVYRARYIERRRKRKEEIEKLRKTFNQLKKELENEL